MGTVSHPIVTIDGDLILDPQSYFSDDGSRARGSDLLGCLLALGQEFAHGE